MAKQEKDDAQALDILLSSEKTQNDVISTLITEYFKTKNNELDVLLRISELWVDCFKEFGKEVLANMQASRDSNETLNLAKIEHEHDINTKRLKLEKISILNRKKEIALDRYRVMQEEKRLSDEAKDFFRTQQADVLEELNQKQEQSLKEVHQRFEKLEKSFEKHNKEHDKATNHEGRLNAQAIQDAIKDSKDSLIDTSVDIAKKIQTKLKGDLAKNIGKATTKKQQSNND